MNNSLRNDFGNLVTICPYCNAHIINQFQVIDLHIYTKLDRDPFLLTLQKVLTKKPGNEPYLKSLLINSLKKKPFIARIILTKPYYSIITELTKTGFLTNDDLKNINIY